MADPGWYQDPENAGGQRYFDGENWTDQRKDEPPPPPSAPKKSGGCFGTVAKVGLGVVLGIGVLIVGCALLIGKGVDDATKAEQEHAITQSQYESIENGTPQADVEDELGEPGDSQDFQAKGIPGSTCIYYNEKDTELLEGKFFQFCFSFFY